MLIEILKVVDIIVVPSTYYLTGSSVYVYMSDLVGRRIATDLVVYVVMGFCVEKGGKGEVDVGCV
jgi:hypothetical protein